jgi:hypothetical protein
MTIRPHRVIARLAFLVILDPAAARGEEARAPVAIACAVSGRASVAAPTGERTRALRLFDWLSAGSVVDVARESSVTLVFASGARYELGERAKATLGTSSLASSTGPVRRLEPLPPLPRVSPIADSARAGARSGAVRIRSATIAHLYPDRGAATLADSTVLRFTPVRNASRYRVEVETETGASVFQGETESPTVAIAAGILKPATKYYWQVRTMDSVGQVARGSAEFVTLGSETARARAALEAALAGAGEAASLALLAEIDRSLGLLVEARDEFRAALARAPGDVALRHALDRLEQQLAADRDKSEE